MVNTSTSHGLINGSGSSYGWGIGCGGNVFSGLAPQIRVPFTTDGRTDYQIDATWGFVVPDSAAMTSPTIPYGRCQILIYLDSALLDQVWLNCAMSAGVLYPADAGGFSVYTSSKNGTTPGSGSHMVTLYMETSYTTYGQYSGAHIGDLASVGTSPHPFPGGPLPTWYTAALTRENCYLRVTGISPS